MDKLFKGFLLFTAALLSISNTNAFEEAYEKDPRRAMLDPQRANLDNTRKQSFEREIQTPGVSKEGFLRRDLSSDNSITDEVQPLESVLTILKEGPSSGSSSSSLSLSPFPSPQLPRNSTPKLPPSPSPQPLREISSPVSAPDVSRVASGTDQLTRSLSSSSLSTGSASPIIFRASEALPLPKSIYLVLVECGLSKEFIGDPRYKPLSNVVNRNGKIIVEAALLRWLVETQAFWCRFNDLSAKLAYAARRVKEKQEAASSDVGSSLEDSILEAPAPPSSGVLGTSLFSEYHLTPEQKRAASLQRGQRKLEAADAAFKVVVAEAKRRHPTLSLDDIIKKLACGLLAESKPDVLSRPYCKDPSDFKPQEHFLAFLLDPTDLKITLFRLPISINRLETENAALEYLLSIYKRELLNRVAGWGQVSSWKDWYNLNGNEGPLNVMKRLLREAYPFISLARHKRDLKTARGIALAALNKDALGLVLWEACLHKIKRINAPYNPAQLLSPEEEQALDVQYRLLPKHFNSDGSPKNFLPTASSSPSFQVVYEGIDLKIPDDDGLRGLKQTSYKIVQRKYTNPAGKEGVFIPMKDAPTETKKDKTGDEYQLIMTELRTSKDTAATMTPLDVFLPNPLVEMWKGMPKKFAVMEREFRTYAFMMSYHRGLWVKILQELHAKQKPILIGCGEGLIRPNEPKPTDDPVRYDYDFAQVEKYHKLIRTLKSLLETNRNLWLKANTSQGRLSTLPRAQEFVVFTRPERPDTEGGDSSKFGGSESLSLDCLGIHDEELRAKYRTPEGLRGIFHNVRELTLVSNKLVSPPLGIDLRSLTVLNVSSNKLVNLNFLNGLWGQLVTLHASNNLITEFPSLEGVLNPTLLDLDISSNHMGSLGPIAKLTLLRELNISGSNVRTLVGLRTLINLETLIADGCGLAGAWEGVIPPLSNLTTLSLNLNFDLVLLPYMIQKVSGSSELALNDEKFNARYPKLRVFREQRELRARQDRPITLSDLRGIIGHPQA